MNVRHVLLTRFNVRHLEMAGRTRDETGVDPRWLDHRLPLFEDLCVRSVAAQTRTDFEWFVFVRPDTPEVHLDRIRELAARAGGRVALSTGGDQPDAAAAIVSGDQRDVLLTTRLDCDDAINRHFVEWLRESPLEPGTINFTRGCQLYPSGRAATRRQRSGSFISYSEPWSQDPLTVWGFRHPAAPDVRQLPHDLAWMQVIHDRNLSTSSRGRRPVSRRRLLAAFDIAPGLVADTTASSLAWQATVNYRREYVLEAKLRLHRFASARGWIASK